MGVFDWTVSKTSRRGLMVVLCAYEKLLVRRENLQQIALRMEETKRNEESKTGLREPKSVMCCRTPTWPPQVEIFLSQRRP